MPNLNQKGAAHLVAVAIILIGIAVGVFLSQNKAIWSPKAFSVDNKEVKTIVWTHIYYNTVTDENVRKIAKANFDGFMIESSGYKGVFDDFLNGGVSRMDPTDLNRFKDDVTKASALSKSLGMESLFIRLTAAETGYWDVFDAFDNQKILQTAKNQAKFAKETGLKGIWIDAEPYNHTYLWRQNEDKDKKAYQKTDQETGSRYFNLGKSFMESLLVEYPDIEVLFAPSFYADGMYTSYKFLPNFYAGMASANPQKGIIRTTEASYGYSSAQDLGFVFGFENALYNSYQDQDEDKNWVSVRQVIKDYNQQNGNSNLLTFFKTKSPLALSFWPQDRSQSQEGIDKFTNALKTSRKMIMDDYQIDPAISKYTWVYDEYGLFIKDEYNRCSLPNYDSSSSCYAQAAAKVLAPPAPTLPIPIIQLPFTSPEPLVAPSSSPAASHPCPGIEQGRVCAQAVTRACDSSNVSRCYDFPSVCVCPGWAPVIFDPVLPLSTATPSATPSTAPSPAPTSTTAETKFITSTISCFTNNLTPDQICKNKSFSKSVAVDGQYSAKGYWWKQCQGASVSNCQGLNCQIDQTDCTKVPDQWGKQQPYPENYTRPATPTTVFNATELGYNCTDYNPGWTVVVACQ